MLKDLCVVTHDEPKKKKKNVFDNILNIHSIIILNYWNNNCQEQNFQLFRMNDIYLRINLS